MKQGKFILIMMPICFLMAYATGILGFVDNTYYFPEVAEKELFSAGGFISTTRCVVTFENGTSEWFGANACKEIIVGKCFVENIKTKDSVGMLEDFTYTPIDCGVVE